MVMWVVLVMACGGRGVRGEKAAGHGFSRYIKGCQDISHVIIVCQALSAAHVSNTRRSYLDQAMGVCLSCQLAVVHGNAILP